MVLTEFSTRLDYATIKMIPHDIQFVMNDFTNRYGHRVVPNTYERRVKNITDNFYYSGELFRRDYSAWCYDCGRLDFQISLSADKINLTSSQQYCSRVGCMK